MFSNFFMKGTGMTTEFQLEKILLSKAEAAQVLSISEKKLWFLTFPRGPIMSVRLGGRVLYSPETLKAFIKEEERRLADSIPSDSGGAIGNGK